LESTHRAFPKIDSDFWADALATIPADIIDVWPDGIIWPPFVLPFDGALSTQARAIPSLRGNSPGGGV
jgi:hypothetical protein